MTDVFVSFNKHDRDASLRLVGALTQEGWSVWSSEKMPPGMKIEREVKRILEEARCVVVLWSANSVESSWVRAEAEEARIREIIIPARLDDVPLPMPYGQLSTVDLSEWTGAPDDPGFRAICKRIQQLVKRQGPPATLRTAPRRSPLPRRVSRLWRTGIPRSIIVALARRFCPAPDRETKNVNRHLPRAVQGWVRQARADSVLRFLVSASTGPTAVIMGLASVFVPLYALFLTNAWRPAYTTVAGTFPFAIFVVAWAVAIIALSLVVLWVTLFIGVTFLERLTPDEYARITLDGRQVSEVLGMIARDIFGLCDCFIKNPDCQALETLIRPPGDEIWTKLPEEQVQVLSRKSDEIATRTRRLEQWLAEQQMSVQRVHAMKHLASDRLGIPARRLCDHVFRFSPSMFRDRVQKYIDNWKEIRERYYLLERGRYKERVIGLLKENREIWSRIDRRRKHQIRMLTYRDLHPFVQSFAADHSASGALRMYGQALSRVASQGWERARPRPQLPYDSPEAQEPVELRVELLPLDATEDWYAECIDRLRFLFLMQKAHPGFELHMTCLQLCKLAAARCSKLTDDTTGQLRRKCKSRHEEWRRRTEVLESLRRKDAALFESTSPEGTKKLLALSLMAERMSLAIERSRFEVCQTFARMLASWRRVGLTSERSLFVTHGYSKTVREALKKGLYGANSVQTDKIFIMQTEDDDGFDARLMEFDLLTGSDDHGRVQEIGIGDERLLTSLITRETKVMVVLGAECFDRDKRAVHPLGTPKRLEELVNAINQQAAESAYVVVVAEGYKYQQDVSLIDIPEFYRDHLDRITLYEPTLVDIIITDDVVERGYIGRWPGD